MQSVIRIGTDWGRDHDLRESDRCFGSHMGPGGYALQKGNGTGRPFFSYSLCHLHRRGHAGIYAVFRAFSESGASLPQLLAQYPVFLLITLAYVVSLLLSFFSFRHLEASVASPLCNTSAAMILLMLLAFYLFSGRRRDVLELLTPLNVLASLLVCGGVIAVGMVRSAEEEKRPREKQSLVQTIKRYGAAAILFPF